jgi:hypothetical protein
MTQQMGPPIMVVSMYDSATGSLATARIVYPPEAPSVIQVVGASNQPRQLTADFNEHTWPAFCATLAEAGFDVSRSLPPTPGEFSGIADKWYKEYVLKQQGKVDGSGDDLARRANLLAMVAACDLEEGVMEKAMAYALACLNSDNTADTEDLDLALRATPTEAAFQLQLTAGLVGEIRYAIEEGEGADGIIALLEGKQALLGLRLIAKE